MFLLALDTATPACAVALARAGEGGVDTLAESGAVDPRRHGELLAPAVRSVLASARVRPAQLGAVGVGLGPGPFTSLRVGVVTAAALSDALGVPAYGVCSQDAVAAQVPRGPVAVVTDARRREVYWAVYADGVRVEGPAVGRPAVVAGTLRVRGVRRVVGAGAALYADDFGELFDAGGPAYPSAAALAELVADRALRGEPAGPLVPLYLRRPDAAAPHPPKPVSV